MGGYKAKQGYVVYRVAVRRGGRKRMVHKGIIYGKTKTQGVHKNGKCARSHRVLAEARVVDPQHNAIRNDPRSNHFCKGTFKHREMRGLTAAGKKSRGLLVKGNRDNNKRPSRRANYLRRNAVRLRRFR